MSTSIEHVTKFIGENFHTWQMKAMYLLMRKNLWVLVKGREPCPSEGAPGLNEWHTKNERALGHIADSLDDDFIHHITGITNAKPAWDELEKLFGTQAKNSKINLLIQFYKLDLKGHETMSAHLNKFKSLKQQLVAIGKIIEDDDAKAMLLASVDKEPYEGIVSTLANTPQTLPDIEAALLAKEKKVKGEETSTSTREEKAFYSRGGYSRHGGRAGRGRGKGGRGTFTCNICGKPGHFARDCYYRKEETNFVEETPLNLELDEKLF